MIITRTEIDVLRVNFDGLRVLLTVFNEKYNLDRKDSITRHIETTLNEMNATIKAMEEHVNNPTLSPKEYIINEDDVETIRVRICKAEEIIRNLDISKDKKNIVLDAFSDVCDACCWLIGL